jgi:hypothetical protein
VYLVFKENILIATLLKRGHRNVDIKFSAHERFWNNIHQVAVWKRGRFKMVGKRLKGKGRVRKGEGVSMVKGVEGVLPISLPGVKKHEIRY